jgi:hypothetical protein
LLHHERHDRSNGRQPDQGASIMNLKTTLFSAVAALLVSGLAVGSAIAPASVAVAAPVKIAFYA